MKGKNINEYKKSGALYIFLYFLFFDEELIAANNRVNSPFMQKGIFLFCFRNLVTKMYLRQFWEPPLNKWTDKLTFSFLYPWLTELTFVTIKTFYKPLAMT